MSWSHRRPEKRSTTLRQLKLQPTIALCDVNFSFIRPLSTSPLCLLWGIVPPPTLIASSLTAAWGTVQIMGRLATACNLLKFKVIFCSPMGTPFACCTAVTNRCNLFIMCPRYALLHMRFALIAGALTCAPDWRKSSERRLIMAFFRTDNREPGCIFLLRGLKNENTEITWNSN